MEQDEAEGKHSYRASKELPSLKPGDSIWLPDKEVECMQQEIVELEGHY